MKRAKQFFTKACALFCSLFIFTSLAYADTGSTSAQDNEFKPVTIFVVRYAEKAKTPADDPLLSKEGELRAAVLSRMLGNAGVDYIYSSQYKRTVSTVAPLAERLGKEITKTDAGRTRELVEKIMSHPGSVNLVAGHSNTVNKIIEALGGGKMKELAETEYDNIFVVTVYAPGKAKVVNLNFGYFHNKKGS